MIDPAPRLDRWIEHSHAGQRTLHEDGLEFGLTLLSDDELAEVQGAKRLRKLPPMAREVDEYWGPRVKGFRVHPESGPKDLLSLEGTYVGALSDREPVGTPDDRRTRRLHRPVGPPANGAARA